MKILENMVKLEVLTNHPDDSSGYYELFVEDDSNEEDYEVWRKKMIKEVKDYIGRYYWHTIQIFTVYTFEDKAYRAEITKTEEERSMAF